MEEESDIKVSLLSGGSYDLFVSANLTHTYPNADTYDFTTKF